jgi:23S rRNA (uracil1939-C5)-methyltransferase
MASFPIVETKLEAIVGGGQALGTYPDGRKLFVWGGLPGETVRVQVTKKRSKLVEGKVVEVLEASSERIAARDEESYLSTSPWQIMTPEAETHYKAALIEEAFELHDIVLPEPIEVKTDGVRFGYRNKVEFSWYWDHDTNQLELAFFQRGSKGKIPVEGTSLAHENINVLARSVRDLLRTKHVEARNLKTLMIRCDHNGNCVWQLYVKECDLDLISEDEALALPALGGEVIYSDPRSPASRITERLTSFGTTILTDSVRGTSFSYATEGFFQVNLPMYETALNDMKTWLPDGPVVDMYSGVGTIGLTIGGVKTTLVELDEFAVREMRRNIERLKSSSVAVHAASEDAIEYITKDATIILDPPRAGLHQAVVDKLLVEVPNRIIYLSCNPVTQARDVALLAERYGIRAHTGYNFFPATPHIEHLVILDRKA